LNAKWYCPSLQVASIGPNLRLGIRLWFFWKLKSTKIVNDELIIMWTQSHISHLSTHRIMEIVMNLVMWLEHIFTKWESRGRNVKQWYDPATTLYLMNSLIHVFLFIKS
jgi:hypothetical protein